ncbi:MAG: spermidine/putrescine transporter substrate-binding protein [Gammaproteobacteria bacterium]|nr:spermidine/putrescine transporter substrate-binding protein [Gammaproteobacteria bacterium]
MGLAWLANVCLMSGCGRPGPTARNDPAEQHDDPKILNLYTWTDYLAPDTLSSFEKLTGIKVRASYFDTNETLEARVLTGNSGFDVVVPTAPFLQRQIRSGAYLPLDKAKLPNLANLDPAFMARVALNDPGNAHAVIYAWGTYGIGYNRKMVADALPNVPLDSWRLIFDPAFASRLAKCGITILDAPAGVVRLVLSYLGKDPNAPTAQDFADVEAVLTKIRPYVRNIDSSGTIEAIANGDICISVAYNGDFVQARKRANEAKNGITIDYLIPREGSLLWFDMLAIPRDAPHASNAHRFIDFLMNPRVIANIANFTGFANANTAATPLLDPSIVADATVYPPPEQQARLFVQAEDSPERSRTITRLWQKFKTAQ